MPDGTLKDIISGKSPSYSFGGVRYDEVNGVQTAFSALQPVVTERGIRCVGAYSNLCLWSEDMTRAVWDKGSAVQSVAVDESGFNVISAGSSGYTFIRELYYPTIGSTYFFTVVIKRGTSRYLGLRCLEATTTYKYAVFDFETESFIAANGHIDFFVTKFQNNIYSISVINISTAISYFSVCSTNSIGNELNIGSAGTILVKNAIAAQHRYPLPYIKTEGTIALSTADSGSASGGVADYGAWFDNVPLQFPRFKNALETKGTLTFPWTPGYNKADVSGDLNIWSFNCTDNSIFYDATNGLIKITDGTNTATCPLTAAADTTYNIKLTWEAGLGARVWVDSTAGTLITSWNGFPTGNDFIFGLNNPELHYVGLPATCYVKPDWSSPL